MKNVLLFCYSDCHTTMHVAVIVKLQVILQVAMRRGKNCVGRKLNADPLHVDVYMVIVQFLL